MSKMTKQFGFHLLGADAPEGELDADQLIAIVGSLKDIATKIGRVETGADSLGRAPKRTQQVARLTIGLAAGSTTVRVHRTGVTETFDFDSAEEQAFDEKFADLVESLAQDRRPEWVGDSLSLATSQLIVALQQAADEVEFTVSGQVRCVFKPEELRREMWRRVVPLSLDTITFTGRLYAVNLNTHHLSVEDAVGNRIALPAVADDSEASALLGRVVTASGTPGYDPAGRLTSIRDATIAAAPDPLGESSISSEVPLEAILRSAPGPDLDGGIDLTDEEFDSFLEAVRG